MKRIRVTIGTKTFALTLAQAALVESVRRRKTGGLYVRRADVVSARALEAIGLGTLTDNGRLRVRGDGERWFFQLPLADIDPRAGHHETEAPYHGSATANAVLVDDPTTGEAR